jgi:hypothetical protein
VPFLPSRELGTANGEVEVSDLLGVRRGIDLPEEPPPVRLKGID